MLKALSEVNEAGCDALVVYLGNFGPERPLRTLLVKYFDGPCMVVAAAEETGDNLVGGRGDAYCGMLNASYNLKLRQSARIHSGISSGKCTGSCRDDQRVSRTIAKAQW